ncbi:550_t:CDS:2, partial [Cetraspora pellucida]
DELYLRRVYQEKVFNKLAKAELKINIEKCEFFKPTIHFLSHIVRQQGIQPDEGDVVEIYMVIKESDKEELVLKNIEEQANEKQSNLPNFKEHLALEILDQRKAIYTIKLYRFNLIASEPKQLLILRDWVIIRAKQKLIRKEYLYDTEINLEYTEPLNLQEIKKKKNANWWGNQKKRKRKPKSDDKSNPVQVVSILAIETQNE